MNKTRRYDRSLDELSNFALMLNEHFAKEKLQLLPGGLIITKIKTITPDALGNNTEITFRGNVTKGITGETTIRYRRIRLSDTLVSNSYLGTHESPLLEPEYNGVTDKLEIARRYLIGLTGIPKDYLSIRFIEEVNYVKKFAVKLNLVGKEEYNSEDNTSLCFIGEEEVYLYFKGLVPIEELVDDAILVGFFRITDIESLATNTTLVGFVKPRALDIVSLLSIDRDDYNTNNFQGLIGFADNYVVDKNLNTLAEYGYNANEEIKYGLDVIDNSARTNVQDVRLGGYYANGLVWRYGSLINLFNSMDPNGYLSNELLGSERNFNSNITYSQ